MTNPPFLPPLTWPALLQTAPYFQSAVSGALTAETLPGAAPLPRAACYFDLFDGEVSNGGVMQYFFNRAFRTPGFEDVPASIAQNPVLSPALPFVAEVHAAWSSVASAVAAAHKSEEWPEELFEAHRERFDALETAYFKIRNEISQRLCADIVQRPHAYFAIEPIPDVPAKGIAHIVLRGGTHRLRFEDGFPIGPNIFDKRDGHCDVVWFSRDRQLLHAETGFMGSRTRAWIHYPSQASGSWHVAEDGRQTIEATRSLWERHGLSESFQADGSLEHAGVYRHGTAVWQDLAFDPDGKPRLRIENRPDGEHEIRYWPSGAVNTESITPEGGRERYLRCLDAEGQDLAPGGTGRLYESLARENGRLGWREGNLVGGYLDGVVRWLECAADGSDVQETNRCLYRNGEEIG